MSDFVRQNADHLARRICFHQKTSMDEYTLPAGNEGVQVAVIDQHNGDGARVQSSYLEKGSDEDPNRILDLCVTNEGDLTLRQRLGHDSGVRTCE